MADNYVTNLGSGGSTFGSDDVGPGVHYPRVKQSVGPDGTAQDGWTPYKLISAASTNATSVKASAATLGHLSAFNLNASPRYLKIYNKASSPTVGSDTPVLVFMIPGNTAGAGFVIPLPPNGIALSTGLAFALTTGIQDSDTGAVAANEICLNLGYA